MRMSTETEEMKVRLMKVEKRRDIKRESHPSLPLSLSVSFLGLMLSLRL